MLERTTAEKQRLRILTYTSLFPNQNQPRKGIFTWQRVSHLAKRQGNCLTVIAPLPYTPHWVPSRRLRFLATFPNWETIEQLTAYHPRYFLVPKIAMPLHGWLMFFGTMDLATFRRKKAVSEAAPVRGGRDGVAFAVQFCPAQFDQA